MATDIPEINLAAIEARLAATTPGPWFLPEDSPLCVRDGDDRPVLDCSGTGRPHAEALTNAQFALLSRADLRALLDEVRRLRNALNATERHHEHSMHIIESALGPCRQDMDTWRAQGIANDIRAMRAALQERSSE